MATSTNSLRNDDKKSIVVFGGNGTIGMGICEQAVKAGFNVVSVSRSGDCPPAALKASWVNYVEWRKGDALNPLTYESLLSTLQPVAVVSSIGKIDPVNQLLWWKRASVERIAGDTNRTVCEMSKKLGVPKFIYISGLVPQSYKDYVVNNKDDLRWYHAPFAWFLAPQILAKQKVEDCVTSSFDKDHGVILRASLTFGRWYYDISVFNFFRLTFSWWLPPFSDREWVRTYFYKSLYPQSASVHDIGNACVRYIQYQSDDNNETRKIEKQFVDACEIENFLFK